MRIFGSEVDVAAALRSWGWKMLGYAALVALIMVVFIAMSMRSVDKDAEVKASVYNVTITSETERYSNGVFMMKKIALDSRTAYLIVVDSEGEPKVKYFRLKDSTPYIVSASIHEGEPVLVTMEVGDEPKVVRKQDLSFQTFPMKVNRAYQHGETGLIEIDRGLWDSEIVVEGWELVQASKE